MATVFSSLREIFHEQLYPRMSGIVIDHNEIHGLYRKWLFGYWKSWK